MLFFEEYRNKADDSNIRLSISLWRHNVEVIILHHVQTTCLKLPA